MIHDKLRILTGLQHWLGSNYTDLPTDSGNMTKRARLYLKEYPNTFDELSDQIIKEEKATALLAVVSNFQITEKNEWISVEDRMPDKDEDVIVKDYSGKSQIRHIPTPRGNGEYCGDDGQSWYPGGFPVENTTHWMKIPK